jgi:3'5'-cyclic nucleotide phosphodiesterase
MSTMKLLKRIEERPDKTDDCNAIRDAILDPISQFTVVFAALIHDVDHKGVPNTQLLKEGTETAMRYGKSIAERHSVDVAWKLLMDPRFEDVRRIIYRTDAELIRFRQLLINCVLSTDISDPELRQLSKQQWEKAFGDSAVIETEQAARNRKATVVMSNLIRVSDISHTMQVSCFWFCYVVHLSAPKIVNLTGLFV